MARWDAATAGRVDRFPSRTLSMLRGGIRRYYNVGRPSFIRRSIRSSTGPRPEAWAPAGPTRAFSSSRRGCRTSGSTTAIEACRSGSGQADDCRARPKKNAFTTAWRAPSRIPGVLDDEAVRDQYDGRPRSCCRADADFGIVPAVEAQACGTPSSALRAAAPARRSGRYPGVLVEDGSPEGFAEGLARFQTLSFDPAAIRANAERFSRERFMTDFQTAVSDAIADRKALP